VEEIDRTNLTNSKYTLDRVELKYMYGLGHTKSDNTNRMMAKIGYFYKVTYSKWDVPMR